MKWETMNIAEEMDKCVNNWIRDFKKFEFDLAMARAEEYY